MRLGGAGDAHGQTARPLVVNLGCGAKTSPHAVNVDWSIRLRLRRNPLLRAAASPFLDRQRRARLAAMEQTVLLHDLRKPLPFAGRSVDAVYHSHLLEHIDRDLVAGFLERVLRVLRPGGIHRVCVPDLEVLVRRYLRSVGECDRGEADGARHEATIAAFLEQCVRREAAGARRLPPVRRWIENALIGDARRRGETHQWMYDRHNLPAVLRDAGFDDVRVRAWNESAIPGWPEFGLETDERGGEFQPDSLYVECRRPA